MSTRAWKSHTQHIKQFYCVAAFHIRTLSRPILLNCQLLVFALVMLANKHTHRHIWLQAHVLTDLNLISLCGMNTMFSHLATRQWPAANGHSAKVFLQNPGLFVCFYSSSFSTFFLAENTNKKRKSPCTSTFWSTHCNFSTVRNWINFNKTMELHNFFFVCHFSAV